MSPGPTVFVSDDAAKAVLTWPEMIETMRSVYAVEHVNGISPVRSLARLPGTWMRSLTAILPTRTVMGTKLFGFSRSKKLNYLIALLDQEDASMLALLDANAITALRTAATSAVAIDRMAPAGGVTLGVLGSGVEARGHVRAIAALRPIEALRVFSPSAANRDAFAKEFAAELEIDAVAVDTPRAAVEGATMVVGATRSRDGKAVLEGAWLDPQTLVVSIGATLPEQREIDTAAIEQAGVIVADMPAEVMNETGCFRDAAAQNVAYADKFVTLNALAMGQADARLAGARYPMYRSIGCGLQDIAIAELAFRKAVEAGLAIPLPIGFVTKSD